MPVQQPSNNNIYDRPDWLPMATSHAVMNGCTVTWATADKGSCYHGNGASAWSWLDVIHSLFPAFINAPSFILAFYIYLTIFSVSLWMSTWMGHFMSRQRHFFFYVDEFIDESPVFQIYSIFKFSRNCISVCLVLVCRTPGHLRSWLCHTSWYSLLYVLNVARIVRS